MNHTSVCRFVAPLDTLALNKGDKHEVCLHPA